MGRRRWSAVALGLWCGLVAVLVFLPTSRRPSALVVHGTRLLRHIGLSGWAADFELWQAVLNVAMFVPVGLAAPGVVPVRGILRWLLIGLCCGCLVEGTQYLLLPHRLASVQDVLTNAAGVTLGYLLFTIVVRRRTAGPGPETSPESETFR